MYIDTIKPTEHLVDCVAELKRLRRLLSDAEWNGHDKSASFYRSEVNYFRHLVRQGVLYEPLF